MAKADLHELLRKARQRKMTLEEIRVQRESFVRAMTTPCEHGELDFEQCPRCRGEPKEDQER